MIYLDFETRSDVDLKRHGGRRYAAGPRSALLCGVAVVDGDPPCLYVWSPFGRIGPRWLPVSGISRRLPVSGLSAPFPPRLGSDDPPEPVLDAVEAGTPIVAHNAHGFDRHVWDELGLPPAKWIDSLELARRAALPGGLDKLGQYLYDMPKDKLGRASMLLHSKPLAVGPKKLRGTFRDPDPDALAEIVRYCIRDVLVMRRVVLDEGLLEPHVDDPVLAAHRRIDERGVCVDLPRVHALLEAGQADAQRHVDEAYRVTRGEVTATTLRSPSALLRWLAKQGVNLPDTKEPTIRAALEGPLGAVRAVLQARLAVARVTTGKAQAILDRVCPDGKLRGMLAYYGAHTGRWAGRGFQPQNLPRGVKGVPIDADCEDAPKVAAGLGVDTAEVLGTMLRGLLVPPPGWRFVIVDYSSIEARVLLWCAEDEVGLQRYRDGVDPYAQIAARVFSCRPDDVTKEQRAVGKTACLACGYQGGPGAFEGYAEKVNLRLPPGLTAEKVVEAWRDAHLLVAGVPSGRWETPDGRWVTVRRGGLWREMQAAAWAVAAEEVESATAGLCRWTFDGQHLYCRLPSGRELIYRDAKIEECETRWGTIKPALVYHDPRRGRIGTYGGKLVENVCQAVARDLLADALVRLEAEGLQVAFHVHDEVVVQVPADRAEAVLQRVEAIMLDPPAWAVGLPVEVEGQVAERFTK